jgi:molybdopterin-guanine dinucleotide biosynthesis protein A
MKILLLCGYRSTDASEVPLGLQRDEKRVTLLDRQISILMLFGYEVITVLSGAAADEQLRQSRRLPQTEMVFDQSVRPSLLSNAREGALSARHEACFVLPVEIPVPPAEIWNSLRNEYARIGFQTEKSVIQVGGAAHHYGFPLLFTRQGAECLQITEDLNGLSDARLSYLHLAPEAKSL